jgi:hypothetical protein
MIIYAGQCSSATNTIVAWIFGAHQIIKLYNFLNMTLQKERENLHSWCEFEYGSDPILGFSHVECYSEINCLFSSVASYNKSVKDDKKGIVG